MVNSGRAVHDLVFCHRNPIGTCCVLVREAWCEAPGNVARGHLPRRGWQRGHLDSASTKAVGSKGRVIWSAHANHCSVVIREQAEGALRLGPKGEWPGLGALTSPSADVEPPAYGWDLRDPQGFSR
jgi:hypothetical protein